jgi:hypothetical protein
VPRRLDGFMLRLWLKREALGLAAGAGTLRSRRAGVQSAGAKSTWTIGPRAAYNGAKLTSS